MITSEIFSALCLFIIVIFTIRGCYFCWKAFSTDYAGIWITVGELLASICWVIIGIDIMLQKFTANRDLLTAVFLIAFTVKAISTILKSEYGYKIVRQSYKSYETERDR